MSTFMLDSGAYGAWSRGEVIDIDHYIAFIRSNVEFCEHYVNLDVIPGSFGHTPDAAEVEVSAQKSWDNLLYMEGEGLQPIPVFHMGERFWWLHRIIEHGCPYVGISPANDRSTKDKRVWLDRVFDDITDSGGVPIVKTHAFGVTAIDLLIRYPWASADSTTWIMLPARGKILVPQWGNGKWLFNVTPLIYYVSEPFGDEGAVMRGLHNAKWREVDHKVAHVQAWLKFCQSDLQLVEKDYPERVRVCCLFFQEFERNLVPTPFKRRKARLFKDL
jgi:hypothetical protein